MKFKQKLFAWFLIVMSYLSSFGISLYSAYYYLAKDRLEETKTKGGAFFFLVVSVIIVIFLISVTKMINKMKANVFKSLFKGFIKIGTLILVVMVTNYISYNTANLINVLQFSILGVGIGTLFESFAVGKYNEYIREVGIL